jgi:hypothetical protein
LRSNKEVESSVIRQRLHLAAANVHIKAAKLARLLKANFNPNQPRVPRGNPDGG